MKGVIMDKYDNLLEGVYRICIALVSIVDQECCAYGFKDEIEMAEEYIRSYEEDRKEKK